MKINKSVIKIVLGIGILFGLGACTGNYDEINKNPYEVNGEEIKRDGYDISVALSTMQSSVVSTDINRTQYVEILLGGAYGRYASESKANTWPNKFSTFDAPDDWSLVLFNQTIPNIYPSLIDLRGATQDSIPLAIADVVKVMAMHRVTDAYGPIPYSKIGEDGALQVPYDSQRDVYMKMFDELDKSIKVLTERQTEAISPNADLIYRGDIIKWIKLANSVKLRLAMRIVYAEPAIAQEKAEQAVSHPIGVMSANGDNAALRTFTQEGNPISMAVKYNDGDHRSVADMTAYMNTYNDPRRAAYFIKSSFPGVEYSGFRSGIALGAVSQFINYSIFNIDRDTPLQWMNVAEVCFLRAEGALRGWTMGDTAEQFYNEGVELSFEQWGVTGASNYLDNDAATPVVYTDPAGTFSHNTPLTSLPVKWDATDDANLEQGLEKIMIQKWLGNFPLGLEAWADRRRTGYPKMIPVIVNNSPGGILADDDVPRRCPYPANEAITNTANYNAAVTMLGGPDNLATRVWWDAK